MLGTLIRFGIGYTLAAEDLSLPNPRTCTGAAPAGSLVVVDLDARMVVAYVMNHMISTGGINTTGDKRALSIVRAAYRATSVSNQGPTNGEAVVPKTIETSNSDLSLLVYEHHSLVVSAIRLWYVTRLVGAGSQSALVED